jgi:hypothetical protein
MGCGPVLGGLIVNVVGKEHSFWVVSGIFAVVAVLYLVMTGLWRVLLSLIKQDTSNTELRSQLIPSD